MALYVTFPLLHLSPELRLLFLSFLFFCGEVVLIYFMVTLANEILSLVCTF